MLYSSELQFRRLQDIIHRVSYKPRVKLEVHRLMEDVATIRVVMIVPDINDPTDNIVFQFMSSLSLYSIGDMTDCQIVEYFVRGAIREAELHEMDEWLKFDGRCVREPHPEEQTRTSAPVPSLAKHDSIS